MIAVATLGALDAVPEELTFVRLLIGLPVTVVRKEKCAIRHS